MAQRAEAERAAQHLAAVDLLDQFAVVFAARFGRRRSSGRKIEREGVRIDMTAPSVIRPARGAARWSRRFVGHRRGPPVTMAPIVFGTSSASATCTIEESQIATMPRKCTSRAPWKPQNSRVNSESCIGFQIAQPDSTCTTIDHDDAGVEQLLHGVVVA